MGSLVSDYDRFAVNVAAGTSSTAGGSPLMPQLSLFERVTFSDMLEGKARALIS